MAAPVMAHQLLAASARCTSMCTQKLSWCMECHGAIINNPSTLHDHQAFTSIASCLIDSSGVGAVGYTIVRVP